MPHADRPTSIVQPGAATLAARVIAVVPTFRPADDVPGHLRSLAEQVDRVIVVDDGSGSKSEGVLAQLQRGGAHIIRLSVNSGIAAALNAGIRAALADGADFVVNTDQDTELPAGYVAECLSTFARANAVTRLGIVCTDKVNGAPSIPTWYSPENLGLVPEAIQSGFVISRECLEEAGLFDEELVIDCVDTEYCLRVRDHGFRIAVAADTDISHALGEMVPLRPLGITLIHEGGRIAKYQYHSPFRQYYITRNNIDLILRYWAQKPRWVLSVARRQTGPAITTMVAGPHRLKQSLAMLVGALHGVLRVRGKMPNWLWKVLTS